MSKLADKREIGSNNASFYLKECPFQLPVRQLILLSGWFFYFEENHQSFTYIPRSC